MPAEQSPEPPRPNEYARCIRAEHTEDIEFWYAGHPDNDVIAGAEAFLYRHSHPYRHIAKKIGNFACDFMSAYGRAMCALPSPEQLSKLPPAN